MYDPNWVSTEYVCSAGKHDSIKNAKLNEVRVTNQGLSYQLRVCYKLAVS